jgi:tetratricopeptide (TPR) repeat protein
VTLFQRLDDKRGEASALGIMADMAAAYVTSTVVPAAPLARALASAEESLRLAQVIGWRAGEAYALLMVGSNWLGAGDFGRAEQAALRGQAVAAEIGHHQWLAAAGVMTGQLHAERLEFEAAVRCLRQAHDLASQVNTAVWRRFAAGGLVQALLELGDVAGAEAVLRPEPGPEALARSLAERLIACAWAEVALARGEAEAALEIVERLAAQTYNLGPDRVPPRLWWLRGRCLEAVGRPDEATEAYCANRAANPDLRLLGWQLHAALSRVHAAQGRTAEATREAAQAGGLIQSVAATLADGQQRAAFIRAAMARATGER